MMPGAISPSPIAMPYRFRGPRYGPSAECRPSGKSTVARAMARTIEAPHLRSDAIRHTLFHSQPSDPPAPSFNAGIYAQIPKRLTYGKLLDQTMATVDGGRSVIVDATFSRPEYRRELKRLARDRHVRLTFVECRARLKVIKSRLREREQHPSLSQARLQDFESFRQGFVPLGGAGMTAHIVVDTTCLPDECVRRILAEDQRVSTACMISSWNKERSIERKGAAMFTSILAATDRVTGRDPVIISAARMASSLGASWSIVHVLPSASPDNHERVLHFRTGQALGATARYRSEYAASCGMPTAICLPGRHLAKSELPRGSPGKKSIARPPC